MPRWRRVAREVPTPIAHSRCAPCGVNLAANLKVTQKAINVIATNTKIFIDLHMAKQKSKFEKNLHKAGGNVI